MLSKNSDTDLDEDQDARSYTTLARSLDEVLESAAAVKIPKLMNLQIGSTKDIECPFCFRVTRFKKEKEWRRHVLEEFRSYVCMLHCLAK